MMDGFIHWPKPYLLLSATYDEVLSWMTNIWIIITWYVIVIATLQIHNTLNFFPQGMTKNVGLTFSVGDTTPRFTNIIEQENWNW